MRQNAGGTWFRTARPWFDRQDQQPAGAHEFAFSNDDSVLLNIQSAKVANEGDPRRGRVSTGPVGLADRAAKRTCDAGRNSDSGSSAIMGPSIAGVVAGTLQHSSDVPHRLPNPMLVLDQRETHIALTSLAEADARGDRDVGLAQQQLGELQ